MRHSLTALRRVINYFIEVRICIFDDFEWMQNNGHKAIISLFKGMRMNCTPLLLIILDGWGENGNEPDNAIAAAHKPQWEAWRQSMPYMALDASGLSVGLPEGQMGNSEVGHMHIGAGRVLHQDFTRINEAIRSGEFAQQALFHQLLDALPTHKKKLHILGLLSAGGVHSHEDHLFAFLKLCHTKGFHDVLLHLFLDGRDSPPQSALSSIAKLNQILQEYPAGRIASICGRYYAMDRDQRWERLEPVYHMLVEGISAHHFRSAEQAIQTFYQQNITDEFIPPTLIAQTTSMQDGDSVFFFNFRADRARQLTQALLSPSFEGFQRKRVPQWNHFVSMTQYADNLPTSVAFPPLKPLNTLGEIIAQAGRKQLRIAETEKYAHVTFFFNGGSEAVFPNEERVLIPSAKVATYDLLPKMQAPQITQYLIAAIQNNTYDVIICNFANADMVGHTGHFQAAVQAIECLDQCLHDLAQAVLAHNGCMLITADHGNAEKMFDLKTGQMHTAHTTQPVPFLFVGQGWHLSSDTGSLIDIAPTVLALLGIDSPKEMTGKSLLEKDASS